MIWTFNLPSVLCTSDTMTNRWSEILYSCVYVAGWGSVFVHHSVSINAISFAPFKLLQLHCQLPPTSMFLGLFSLWFTEAGLVRFVPNKLNALYLCDLNDISKFSTAVFSFFGSIYRCTLYLPSFTDNPKIKSECLIFYNNLGEDSQSPSSY